MPVVAEEKMPAERRVKARARLQAAATYRGIRWDEAANLWIVLGTMFCIYSLGFASRDDAARAYDWAVRNGEINSSQPIQFNFPSENDDLLEKFEPNCLTPDEWSDFLTHCHNCKCSDTCGFGEDCVRGKMLLQHILCPENPCCDPNCSIPRCKYTRSLVSYKESLKQVVSVYNNYDKFIKIDHKRKRDISHQCMEKCKNLQLYYSPQWCCMNCGLECRFFIKPKNKNVYSTQHVNHLDRKFICSSGCYLKLQKTDPSTKDQYVEIYELPEVEEAYVSCKQCGRVAHIGCAQLAYNCFKTMTEIQYECPDCRGPSILNSGASTSSAKPPHPIDQVPEDDLSRHIEQYLSEMCSLQLSQIPYKLIVRTLSETNEMCYTHPLYKTRFESHKESFSYKQRHFSLFLHSNGNYLSTFSMIVHEYMEDSPSGDQDQKADPNKKCVYLSYLEGLHYLSRDKNVRTTIFQNIVVAYMLFVQKMGFENMFIWSCNLDKRYCTYIYNCKAKRSAVATGQQISQNTMISEATERQIRLDEWYGQVFQFASKYNITYMKLKEFLKQKDIKTQYPKETLNFSIMPYMKGDVLDEILPKYTAFNDLRLSQRLSRESYFVVKLNEPSSIFTPSGTHVNSHTNVFADRWKMVGLSIEKRIQFYDERNARVSTGRLLEMRNNPSVPNICQTKDCGQEIDVFVSCEDLRVCTTCLNTTIQNNEGPTNQYKHEKKILDIFSHFSICDNQECYASVRQALIHLSQCPEKNTGSCALCEQTIYMLHKHYDQCENTNCYIYGCDRDKCHNKTNNKVRNTFEF